MKKILGLLAVAGLLFVAAPSGPAQAMSLANPGAAAAARQAADGVTTNVDWRRVPTIPYSHRHRYRHRHHGWHRHRVHRHHYRHHHRHHRHHR
ncbi:hypothetical protein ACSVBT_20490 [Afipia sp. TerB]